MADLFDIQKQERISQLVALIKKYQASYYNGEAEIEDAEFDKLWDELKELDSSNPILQKVGADSGNFAKVNHVMPMGSQEKAANPEQFLSWAKNHRYDEYLVEYKLDGASLELQFQNGNLVAAVTRGDGVIGDDITSNVKKMLGVPSALYIDGTKINYTGGVRGEVIMTHQVHQSLYSDKANCRNAANGLMKRKDGKGCENLKLICYDAFATTEEQPFKDEEEKILWLNKCGFNTVPVKICKSAEQVIEYREQVMQERKDFEFDIDGLVIKERVINHEDASRARPDRQIAFKFSLEEAVSILREVEWSESGATYTPVAIFDEVQLNGTTVQRASLANPDTVRSLGVKIGCKVVVVKRGEIIPKIEKVIKDEDYVSSLAIKFPTHCNTCKTQLIDDGSRLYCPNKNCPKKIHHQLLKWQSVIDIRDLGETLISELFKNKQVNKISDFYNLTVENLSPYFLNAESLEKEKDSLGAQKVYDSIQSHKNIKLSQFIAGFDIEGIGETTVQKLVEAGFDTFEKLLNATQEQIASVYGFAEITAKTFVQGLLENKQEMLYLKNNVLKVQEGSAEGVLKGKSFCFTGELVTMKRSDAENLVKKNGGTCKSSVTKDLTYLVTNDTTSGSSKNVKAATLDIPVITEEEFLKLLP